MKLTAMQIQKDLDALPENYKTRDVDRLIGCYVRQKADVTELRAHILSRQQFHRIYFFVSLKQIPGVSERMDFIHRNLLFSDWWHTDQIISFVRDLELETALSYAKNYVQDPDPFIRRWGYVLFISRLGRGHAQALLPLLHPDEHYYVQMAQGWLLAELAVEEPETVYGYLGACCLDYSICGKAIQKICDSYRIEKPWKDRFRALRARWKE